MSIHTCSYYCDRPECIRAQRDELRQKLEQAEDAVLAEREACAALCSAVAAGRDAEAIKEAIRARGET